MKNSFSEKRSVNYWKFNFALYDILETNTRSVHMYSSSTHFPLNFYQILQTIYKRLSEFISKK